MIPSLLPSFIWLKEVRSVHGLSCPNGVYKVSEELRAGLIIS